MFLLSEVGRCSTHRNGKTDANPLLLCKCVKSVSGIIVSDNKLLRFL